MKLQIYRTGASNNFNSQFLSKEQRILEEIENISYIQSLNNIDPEKNFIIISGAETKPEDISPKILDKTVLLIHPHSEHHHFNKEFFSKYSFPIILGNPIRANAVAEFNLGVIFSKFNKMINQDHWSQENSYERKLLRDQTVLILGYGHIGKLIHDSLNPLCRSVKVYDPNINFSEQTVQGYSQYTEDIFHKADIVIVATELNHQSHHMINANTLKLISPEAIIINSTGAGVICEEDLKLFLQKNPKAYCHLDVFEHEPFKPGYLNDLKNLTKSSHIAGLYDKLNNDIISFEYLIIKDFLKAYIDNQTGHFENEYSECLLKKEVYNQNEKQI